MTERKQEVKGVKGARKDAKIGRIRREEREREQEKAFSKKRISIGAEQRRKEIQRALENRLKRGHQEKETNHKGSEKEEEVS